MRAHANTSRVDIRPASGVDRSIIEALVAQSLATTRFAEVPSYAVRAAFERPTRESRAIVADRASVVAGFALFGEVAGAIGTGRLHFIGVPAEERRHGVGAALCEAAVSQLSAEGARSVVAEMPDDPLLTGGRALLARCGFVETSRVPDYYSDGVDLVLLQRTVA